MLYYHLPLTISVVDFLQIFAISLSRFRTPAYKVGILGNVLQMLKLPDGTVKVLVEGKKRIHTGDFEFKNDFIKAGYKDFPEIMISFDKRSISTLLETSDLLIYIPLPSTGLIAFLTCVALTRK